MSLDHGLVDNGPQLIMTAYTVIENFIASGNQVAVLRKGELDHLQKLLEELNVNSHATWPPAGSFHRQNPGGTLLINHDRPVLQSPSLDLPSRSSLDADLAESLTTADIMDLVNSIDDMDVDWVSQIIGHDSIW
jgi:proline utilization trans-activator